MATDNLSSRKGWRVRDLPRGIGEEMLYRPPYLPDPNAIEQAFVRLKHLPRAARKRTTEAL